MHEAKRLAGWREGSPHKYSLIDGSGIEIECRFDDLIYLSIRERSLSNRRIHSEPVDSSYDSSRINMGDGFLTHVMQG